MTASLALGGGLAALGGALLARRYRADARAAHAWRAGLLDAGRGLLDDARVEAGPDGYPVLAGRFEDLPVRVRALAEAVAVRKLPALWLIADVEAPSGVRGVLDLLMRPANVEFFSPHARLEERVEAPEGWPEGAVLKARHAERLPGLACLEPHLGPFRHGGPGKELLLTPRLTRLVVLGDEGARGSFLLLRQGRFAEGGVPADRLADLVRRVAAVHRAVGAACAGARAA
ncbi:MAG: hypothetical protein KDG89_02685 [Geminicoccaceae bacterium]|nr:hypothetical protein [Geminicoccaceae bacterium]